ncbi:efflux RND transporter periplasmic adaptor subunit [Nostoc sp. FACHB-110]|uniref:efflux RND transporter periplasmic adaptor subunit n=1 Tax=Nostoc sp. FACHB-110 TaxID=2692834 RepID=UPI00168485AB|nr:efflux RND transporter periplasmic adaptor subunit [Nostoc sp. FACHB-110]MBD2435585.1 efflux RND transporter periplasmic adaptor subunit [Nostoc sp. FACHB-110]
MALNPLDPINYPNLPELDSTTSLPALKQPILKKWLLRLLVFCVLVGGGYLAYNLLLKQQPLANHRPPIVPLQKGNFAVTISANGTVEPEHVINLSPKTAGLLESLLVKEGDYVSKGQVLARMDDSNWQGQLIQQRGQLAQAQANLRKLIAGNRPEDIAQAEAKLEELQANLSKLIAGNRSQDIAQAQARLNSSQASLRKAEDEYRRTQQLYNSGAISLQSLNQKLADRDTAQAQVVEAQQALSLQKVGSRQEDIAQARAAVKQQQQQLKLLQAGSRQEDIDQARAEVLAARGALQNVQTQINDTLIRAPFDGTIIRKYADPGAFVTPTTAGSSVSSATSSSILALADTNQVVANVSESDIAQIRIGQQVIVKADAYPSKKFLGKVSQIAAQATVEQNVTSFEVKATLDADAQKFLRSGMNVSLEFQVGQLQNVLTVPTVAITRQQNVAGVFVARKGELPKFTPITTGATVNNRTEVKTGLDGTEQILLTPPPSAKDKPGFSLSNLLGGSKDGPPGGGPPPGGGGPPR